MRHAHAGNSEEIIGFVGSFFLPASNFKIPVTGHHFDFSAHVEVSAPNFAIASQFLEDYSENSVNHTTWEI
jgi:hypothetical protein